MPTLDRIERILSAFLSIATIIGVGILVEARIHPRETSSGRYRTEAVKDWKATQAKTAVDVSGSPEGIELAVFTDYECPVCRAVDSALLRIQEKEGLRISHSIVHFPLPGHAHARTAALALECAAAQGRAKEMHHSLFNNVGHFNEAPWADLARTSQVGDTALFRTCLENLESGTRIQAGLELGKDLGISGTPAYVIEGVLYDAVPFHEVEKAIRDAKSRKKDSY